MQDFDEVARGLEEIAALLSFRGEPKFKQKAYATAAAVVRTVGTDLGPLVEQNRLRALQGIGAALSKQIEELWNTGRSEYLARLRAEAPEGAAELVQVESMTPRRIRALSAALDVRSVEDLRAACAAGRVRSVAGFGARTEERLAASCERWLERGEQAPRRTLLSHALDLAAAFERELLPVGAVTLAGDLRRGEETVTDLELVVLGDHEGIVSRLSELRSVLRLDRATLVAELAFGLRLKVHVARRENSGSVLVRATGNGAHVQALAERALARGVSLDEFATELELYGALGLSWVPPELRQGRDELERAEREGFEDLVTTARIRGLIHCHTTYSDGRNSVLEMAEAAHALGMEYITITDHSPSAHYAGGLTLDRLKEQWDEIDAVRERVPIRILKGTESDITAEGSLDFPDAVLERFDVIIASIHARHRMDRAAMTRRLERAMEVPVFKIWGHALGRILNHRDPIECDVPAVLDALARSRGAIEINADPHRLDLPPSWIPAARQRGIPFVVSVDAHSTNGLRVLPYGITMARRGGLSAREVLNTYAAADFEALVRPSGPGATGDRMLRP